MLYGTTAVALTEYLRRCIEDLLSLLLFQSYLPIGGVVIVFFVIFSILVYERVITEIILVYRLLILNLFLLSLNFCHLALINIIILLF